MTEETGRVEISDDEAKWYRIVLPDLGPTARTIAHFAKPLDEELLRRRLGYVFSFGTYEGRTQHSIDIKVRHAEEGVATIRQVLQALEAPQSTSIRRGDHEYQVYEPQSMDQSRTGPDA